jgi:Uma2 family endonuclease
MSTAALNRYTPEEYLAIDRHAEFKSEYIDGEIVAMTGASMAHNWIVANLGGELHSRLRGSPCRSAQSDMRVKVSPSCYVYPDVVVVCGEPRLEDKSLDTLLNPALVIEVLSHTTEHYDRGEKFEHYRTVDTLREYVLVSQRQARVDRFARIGDDWAGTLCEGLGSLLNLQSVGCEIPLRDIYYGVDLEPAPPRLRGA